MFRILGLVLALLACPALAGEWRYTDGAGITVILPEPPRRIIAHSTVAAALIAYGIRPVGILRDGPPSLDRSLDGLDISDIPVVSRGWFEIDAEAVLNLDPDLIVTEYSQTEHIYQGGTHEDAISGRLAEIAPVVGIPRGASIVDILETYRGFAASLGADSDSDALRAETAHFHRAVSALQQAAEDRPGLSILAVSPYESGLAIGVPASFGELHDWSDWGVPLLSPPADPGSSYHSISWENAPQYRADIILVDDRWEQSGIEVMTTNPMAGRLPAVMAGQLGDWPAEWIRTYGSYAAAIEDLTALIENSDPHLVE